MATEVGKLESSTVEVLHDLDPLYAQRYMEQRCWIERGQQRLEWAGLITGFLIAMAFLIASTWLITNDQPIAGSVLGSVDLLALTALFITRKRD